MPKSGMAMEEGIILRWFKKEGDQVETGEPLLEIETDKVNMEIESPASGVFLKIVRQEGETVPVTETIGWIGQPGEDVDGLEVAAEPAQAVAREQPERPGPIGDEEAPAIKKIRVEGEKIAATPLARKLAEERGIDLHAVTPTGSFGEIKARDVEQAKAISATPLARKIAEDLKVDLSLIQGTGIGGKIKEADVLAAVPSSPGATREQVEEKEPVRKPMRGIRKVIAERMLASHLAAPPVTLNSKADVTELLEVRKKLNETLDIKISINDILLKITAITLKEYPAMNVSIDGDELVQHPFVNLGMAVALEEGLIVPVIRNADRLTLQEISSTAKDLVEKARNGNLKPDDYTGGTFTVSNLGPFDIYSFTPIINQPESGILGVCAIEDQLALKGSEVEVRKMMGLSLTFDHRAIDGAQSAVFLKKIKTILEKPYVLMAY